MIARRLMVLLLLTTSVPCLADGASHKQSAEELVRVMRLEETSMAGVNAMFELQMQQNPMLLPYRDVFQKWAKSFLTWEAIGPPIADLYVAAFTEQELNEMTAFYSSPTGQKALAKLEDLVREAGQVGQRVAEQHQGELQEMIRQRAEELQQTAKPGEANGEPN